MQPQRLAAALLLFCLAAGVGAKVTGAVDFPRAPRARLKISETLSLPKASQQAGALAAGGADQASAQSQRRPEGVGPFAEEVQTGGDHGAGYRGLVVGGLLLLAMVLLIRHFWQNRAAFVGAVEQAAKTPLNFEMPKLTPIGAGASGFVAPSARVASFGFSGRAYSASVNPALLRIGVTAVPTPAGLRNPKFMQRFRPYAWRPPGP